MTNITTKQTTPKKRASRPRRKTTTRPARTIKAKGSTTTNPDDVASTNAKPVSKLDRIVSLITRPQGATLAELCKVTGWQAHSVRGALAGALKRKGITINSSRIDGVRHYRIGSGT